MLTKAFCKQSRKQTSRNKRTVEKSRQQVPQDLKRDKSLLIKCFVLVMALSKTCGLKVVQSTCFAKTVTKKC